VRALQLTPWSPRIAYAAAAGRYRPDAWAGGRGSPLRLTDLPSPALPDDGWARVDVTMAGICGSDLKFLKVRMPPVATAFVDWRQPIVLGHEIVGTVSHAGSAAGIAEGTRVVAEPILSCRDRGFAPCDACRAGEDHRCGRAAEAGTLPAGHGFGFNARYGGGWAEQLVVPAWRCLPVPDELADEDAVLAEPLAVAVHAVDRMQPPRRRVLVVGPGTIGLSVVMALRALHPDVEIGVAALGTFADERSRHAGAHHLLHGSRRTLIEAAAQATGAQLRRPVAGPPVLDGGYDAVIDCVGSPQTIDDALRVLRPGGELVMVALAGRQRVDWSLVWLRELTVTGTLYYADRPDGSRAFATALDILRDRRPGELVTHRFPLEQATTALQTAAAGPAAGAVKVVFTPQTP